MTLTLVPCWLAGTSIADPVDADGIGSAAPATAGCCEAPAADGDHLKPGRGHAQLIVFEQRGNVEIEMALVVRNLLDDDADIVDGGHLRAGDRAARGIDHGSLNFRGAKHRGS